MERSGTARQPQLLGQKKDKFWLTVGLCALTAALFFLPFYLIDGGFFHYAGDFNSQQISFYRYMNGFIKGAGYPDSAFTSVHNTFSWATDLGSGVMNAYSFYLYGSPFFWFSLLFPQGWLPYLMVPLLVLKFAVAGGGAYLYLRRYVKNIDYAVLGACLYTFSGFTVYNVFFNHFVDVVALFPYLLWSLDEGLMAVLCPAGENSIDFVYQPDGIRLSRALTLGGIVVWLAYTAYFVWRKRRTKRA